jgi:3',5'-cyclic AMP phosphodiesterase CpdA
MAVTKVLHVSDVHLENGFPGVPLTSFINKRIVGLANLRLRRRRAFAEAAQKVEALVAFSQEQEADLVICTGDYTALGTEPEIAYARCPATTTSTSATRSRQGGSISTLASS